MSRTLFSLVFLTLVANPALCGETYRVSNTEEFNRAVGSAKPGDRILLNPGEYGNNYFFRGIHGTAENPILIAAANPNRPPRFVGKDAPLGFGGASHLELRDLVISGSQGNGLNI